MHWPFKQPKTSRNQKILPYHQELKKSGACFGVSGGYERPMWFALNKDKAEYKYSYNYQNWFPSAEFETKNTITNVGLFELTPFSKFDLKGEKSHDELQRLSTANIKDKIGHTTYTQMLNKDGGIEADLTVVCLEKNHFRIIGPAATREHDKFHIKKHLSKSFELKDVTEDYCCLGLFGPNSRNLISKISDEDYSNKNFKFGTGKYVNISGVKVWIQRLSYVGELGFELYIDIKMAKKIYNLIIEEGKKHKLTHCGMHAMDIMRMESGFLHWGHDISPEENQYEAGLNFAISFKKNVNFIGKEALMKIKDTKQTKRFIILSLKESKPGYPLLLHYEPIYLEDKIIGNTTSGNYSFNFNKNLSYGYINNNLSDKDLANKKLYIEVEKRMYEAKIHHKPLKQNNYKLI